MFCVCVCFLSLSLSSIPACFFLVCYFASFLFLRSGCGVCVASAVVWAVWQQMAKRIPPVSTTKVAPAMVPLLAWLALLLLCHAGQGMAALSCFAIGREQPAWPGATIVTPAGFEYSLYSLQLAPGFELSWSVTGSTYTFQAIKNSSCWCVTSRCCLDPGQGGPSLVARSGPPLFKRERMPGASAACASELLL